VCSGRMVKECEVVEDVDCPEIYVGWEENLWQHLEGRRLAQFQRSSSHKDPLFSNNRLSTFFDWSENWTLPPTRCLPINIPVQNRVTSGSLPVTVVQQKVLRKRVELSYRLRRLSSRQSSRPTPCLLQQQFPVSYFPKEVPYGGHVLTFDLEPPPLQAYDMHQTKQSRRAARNPSSSKSPSNSCLLLMALSFENRPLDSQGQICRPRRKRGWRRRNILT
jgi:hypothetical protein